VFNQVPITLELSEYNFSTPIFNALNRNGWAKPGDVLKLHIRQIRNFKNVGQLKVRELLAKLIEMQTQFAIHSDLQMKKQHTSTLEDFLPLPAEEGQIPPDESLENSQETLKALHKLSMFMKFYGAAEEPIFEFIARTKLYDREDFAFLKSMTAESTFPTEVKHENLPLELAFFVSGFSDKEIEVLKQRMLTYPHPTLDAIGAMLGVTRERVRQLEAKVKARFAKLKSENLTYQMLLTAVDVRLGEPMLKKAAFSNLPVLAEKILGNHKMLDLLVGLDELIPDGDWLMRNSKRVASEFGSVLKNSENERCLPEKSTFERLAFLWPSFNLKTFKVWMAHSGYQPILDHWVKTPTLIDYGYVALQKAKEPLSAKQIFDVAKSAGNVRTLENALAASELFTRTGKKLWSLTSWGNQAYKSIREAIEEIVDHEGSIAFDQLVARLADFGVKRSSVRAYATSPPFMIAGGYVRRTAAKRLVRKTIESTRNLYFWDEGVAYRFLINREHLRGSGSSCPVALAKHLGVPDQGRVTLEGPHGEFRVSSKGHMYHLPSTRQAIEFLGLDFGDEILLRFLSGKVTFSKVIKQGKPDVQIRSIIGASKDADLTESLSFSFFNRSDATLEEILFACEKRKETDLAILIGSI
jgi:hypothetical protein